MRSATRVLRITALLLAALTSACTDGPKPATPHDVPDAPAITPKPKPADAPAEAAGEVAPRLRAIVDAADRLPEDKLLDQGRKPGEMLAFFDVREGQKVAELGAGGGYTSELLARAVGPTGTVWGQNTPLILQKFAEKPWSARLTRDAMKNVKRADREFDDPLPAEAKDLDAVFVVLFYHDLYWMKVDRQKMNTAVFKALKPGGTYAIIDHAGKAGTGETQVQTLHRIEESLVRTDIEKAGFVLEKSGTFLKNPADTMDWNASPGAAADKRGTSDRFVLLFKKPR
jgi:predicted methyltransferase